MSRRKYPIIEGGHVVDDVVHCDVCGEPGKGRMVLHMDFDTEFYSEYVCAKCGNHIGITEKRSKEDMMYWR